MYLSVVNCETWVQGQAYFIFGELEFGSCNFLLGVNTWHYKHATVRCSKCHPSSHVMLLAFIFCFPLGMD
jgi:hypothetical protein